MRSVDDSQRRAARVVGFVYLFAMAVAISSEAFGRARLIVPDSASVTASNILQQERLFRLAIAGYLLFLTSNVVLIAGLYAVLESVDKNLAVFAAIMRLMQVAVGAAVAVTSLDVLHLLSGAGYLQSFRADQLQALAMAPLGAYHDKMSVSLIFLGLGSAVFGYLWYKSKYIPRALALLGVFGSSALVVSAFSFLVFPSLLPVFAPAYFVPHFVFEVAIGALLLLKPLPTSERRAPQTWHA
jgi:Domain of unknown function (DUF4386)